jgi:hypothetical protein
MFELPFFLFNGREEERIARNVPTNTWWLKIFFVPKTSFDEKIFFVPKEHENKYLF